MQRIGIMLQVRKEQLEEYNRIHQRVWPEMLQAIREAGIRNYTIFQRDDGLQFGSLECEDWDTACAFLDQHPVNLKWQESMKEFLIVPEGAAGSQPVMRLREIFHTD